MKGKTGPKVGSDPQPGWNKQNVPDPSVSRSLLNSTKTLMMSENLHDLGDGHINGIRDQRRRGVRVSLKMNETEFLVLYRIYFNKFHLELFHFTTRQPSTTSPL